jgi:casein kinase 1 delta
VRLIDFGLSTPFLDKNGEHVKIHERLFEGNLAFCSKYSMRFMSRSRRDDMISLGYLLVYLNQGFLPFLLNLNKEEDEYKQIVLAKEQCTSEILCGEKSKIFLEFIKEIEGLQYF